MKLLLFFCLLFISSVILAQKKNSLPCFDWQITSKISPFNSDYNYWKMGVKNTCDVTKKLMVEIYMEQHGNYHLWFSKVLGPKESISDSTLIEKKYSMKKYRIAVLKSDEYGVQEDSWNYFEY